jgi:hypothetical protein
LRAKLPDVSDINRKNGEFWASSRAAPSVSAGSDPRGAPPPGNAATGRSEGHVPNAAGSIDVPARLSHASKMDQGKLFGVNDAALKQADVYRAQTARANQLVAMISRKNAAFYGKK